MAYHVWRIVFLLTFYVIQVKTLAITGPGKEQSPARTFARIGTHPLGQLLVKPV